MATSKESGFHSLYDDIAGDLKGLAIRRLRNHEDAEDLVQEAFLRLHREQTRATVDNPRGFVFRVGWRLIQDGMRRRKTRPSMSSVTDADPVVSDHRTPEVTMHDREALHDLLAAIRALPPQARRVFVLRRISGHSYDEIASALGISRSTVKNHMIRAMSGIEKYLTLISGGTNE